MKSPLCYIGGKSRLAGKIIDQIPEHSTYCEVFGGACWVLFSKEASKYDNVKRVSTTYSIRTTYQPVQELLIRNW